MSECEACEDDALVGIGLTNAHHALLAKERARAEAAEEKLAEAVELIGATHDSLIRCESVDMGRPLSRCLKGEEWGNCAVEKFLASLAPKKEAKP